MVYWSIAKGNEGFGLHFRPINSTQPSRIANLFMKLRSPVLEMIVFRLQRFKTLRGVMVHHQNCVVLNNSQVLVREKPSFKFKVANRLVTGRRLFSLFFFAFSNFKNIFLGLSDADCKVYAGSASGALRVTVLKQLPKATRIKQQKSGELGGTEIPAKVTKQSK